MSFFARTQLLIGEDGVRRLQNATVAVFGLGGVGSFVAEALCRAGIGHLILVDADTVAPSNLNRQLIALQSTLGMQKTEAARQRILDIHPETRVSTYPIFYEAATADTIALQQVDYIADAIDTVTSKLLLIERANAYGVPIISCMGTGNKLDPSRLQISDVSQTRVCPLARVMRKELKTRGISRLKVLWSDEPPLSLRSDFDAKISPETETDAAVYAKRRAVVGSISFVPSSAGLLIAGEIIRDLLQSPVL